MTEETITIELTPQQIRRKRANGEAILPEDSEEPGRHVISVRLENHVGALNRVVNLFSARSFNLESVTVGETEDPDVSRLTLVTSGTRRQIKQVLRLLDKLLDTLSVDELDPDVTIERELCLLKVSYTADNRAELMDIAEIFRAKVVNVTPASMTFEVTGPTSKVNAFIGMMKRHGIDEVARSGRVAMHRELAYEHD